MKIIFLLDGMDPEELLQQAGAKELKEELEQAQDCWEARKLPLSLKERQKLLNCSKVRKTDIVLITDSPDLAVDLKSAGFLCVGWQRAGNSAYFSGVRTVFMGLEGINAVYLRRILCRFFGKTVEIVRTKRLLIRESKLEDFTFFCELEKIEIYEQKKEQERFDAYIHSVYDFYGYGLWTVEELDTGTVVGRCGISLEDSESSFLEAVEKENHPEIGYLIGKSWRRKGYAEEACRAILKMFFDNTEYRFVFARIHEENIASRCLAERLGFACTGEKKGVIQTWYLDRESFQTH